MKISPWTNVLLLVLSVSPLRAQPPSPGPAAPTLESLDPLEWIQGTWIHDAEGKYMEEHWSATQAASMLGTFRMVREGQVKFYELMTLTLENGRAILRIRHYTSALEPWEEKPMPFVLREVSPAHAIFVTDGTGPEEKLTYTVNGDDMAIVLDAVHEGKPQQSRFELRRSKP